MDNLRATIDIIFNQTPPEFVIDNIVKYPTCELTYSKSWFTSHYSAEYNSYTDNQIEQLFASHEKDIIETPINLLCNYTNEIIETNHLTPKINYRHLLRWNAAIQKMDDDALVCASLAKKDWGNYYKRQMFSWKPVLGHNNECINTVLNKEMSELHFHLKGSSSNFILNWVSLMNDVKNRASQFKNFKSMLSLETTTVRHRKKHSLHQLLLIAAYIRQYLFTELFIPSSKSIEENLNIRDFISNPNFYVDELQNQISLLKNNNTWRAKSYHNAVYDYAIPGTVTIDTKSPKYSSNIVYFGERRFLYTVFQHVLFHQNRTINSDQKDKYNKLIYLYLLIKNKFRKEILQLNKQFGFANFQNFQNRKTGFLKEHSIYNQLVKEIAIKSAFQNNHLRYLEARIAPTNDYKSMVQTIQSNDANILGSEQIIRNTNLSYHLSDKNSFSTIRQNEYDTIEREITKDDFQYIIHFIKKSDSLLEIENNPLKKNDDIEVLKKINWIQRHKKQRNCIQNQATFIKKIMNSNTAINERICGIDAASSEIDARPEVYAQAFRYLRQNMNHSESEYRVPYSSSKLGITYHAGEDFLDLTDGLRAIEETIIFLDYQRGDRIGHALALGLNADDYYSNCKKCIVMNKLDLLDNLVWLMIRSSEYAVSIKEESKSKINRTINTLQREIYNNSNWSLTDLFNAWLLRGCDPNVNMNYQAVDNTWEAYDKHIPEEIKDLEDYLEQEDNIPLEIFKKYQFCSQVRKNGNQKTEFIFPDEYPEIIDKIQQKMRWICEKRGFIIETNPSSNLLIGNLKSYDKHPITNFCAPSDLQDEHTTQIPVSINTDDLGVFNTSIENEYSLMALALHKSQQFKKIDVPGYINKIREMSNYTSFKKKVKTQNIKQ